MRTALDRATFLAALAGTASLGVRRRAEPGWHHEHGPNGLTVNPAAVLDLAVPLLDGTPFRLEDHRGKVVALNVFATWCGPCRSELPDLGAFAAEHAADTVVVSVDSGEPAETVRAFSARFGLRYAIGFDEPAALANRFSIGAYPTTLFVRPDGRLACAFVGELSRETLESERSFALRPG